MRTGRPPVPVVPVAAAVLAAAGSLLSVAQLVWPVSAIVYDPPEGDRSTSGLALDPSPVRTLLWTWGRSRVEGPDLGGVDFTGAGNVLLLVGLAVAVALGLGGAALFWWVRRPGALPVGAVGVTVAATAVLGQAAERVGQQQVFGPGARVETTWAGHVQTVAALVLVAAVVVALWPAGRSLVLEGVGRVRARRGPRPDEGSSADLAPDAGADAGPGRPRVGVARLDAGAPTGDGAPARPDRRRGRVVDGPPVGFSDDEADGPTDRAPRHPRR
ncbi:hypothetical protein [Terracoccus luteus]|uniref:Uncharacterized protein n=1 Tax=Terracoccus luteus TaxID=53356 RepID=A0A839Q0W6_9MICO|nr:hypothetical protein [Terracoccus luteus]MBB2987905.1 hypothetical protein [Terracoccus luteus]MCP2173556.1 hypothetical protein [Terracoccus luteus]